MEAVTNELWAYSTQGRKELHDAGCSGSRPRTVQAPAMPCQMLCFRPIPLPESSSILSPSCILGAATWQVERRVLEAQRTVPDPGSGPPNRLFVPDSVRSDVLQWGHSSFLSSPTILVSLGPFTFFSDVFGNPPSSEIPGLSSQRVPYVPGGVPPISLQLASSILSKFHSDPGRVLQ